MINYIVIFIFISIVLVIQNPLQLNKGKRRVLFVIFPVAFISSLLVGLRPLNAGYDTFKYINYYRSVAHETYFTFFNKYSYNWETEYLYRIWSFSLSNLNVGEENFLLITAFVSIFLFLIALKKLFKEDYLLIFLFFYATPPFVALFGNAIRQGLSLPFFILAIAYFFENKKFKLLLSILCTLFIHNYTGVYLIIILVLYKFLSGFIEKKRIAIFFILLFLQPLGYFLTDYIYRLYPTKYTEFIGAEYFFHYSFILFLLLYVIYRIKNRLTLENDKQLFSIYIIISGVSSLLWFNPIAYGRVLYLGFPFLALYINNLKYFYKSNWVVYLLILMMFGAGIYFFTSPSTQGTLTSLRMDKIHEFVNIQKLC